MIPDADALEAVKKNVKKIKRAGLHTEIFGWILLCAAAGGLWLFPGKIFVCIWFGVFFALGIFFICSGKYIKAGFGRRTKTALLANSIVSFPLSFAILPIYICVISSSNYTRFKDLPDKIQQLFNKPRRLHIGIVDIIAAVLITATGVTSVVLKLNHLNGSSRAAAHAAVPVSPVNDLKTKYQFTIDFPRPAEGSEMTETISGQTVHFAAFATTAANNGGDYKVYAYNYPSPFFKYAAMPQPALAATVHKSITALIKDMQCVMVNSDKSMSAGYPSEDATFTCTTYGGSKTGYMRLFFIGNYEYSLFTIGSSIDDFNSFTNSFRYTGSRPQLPAPVTTNPPPQTTPAAH